KRQTLYRSDSTTHLTKLTNTPPTTASTKTANASDALTFQLVERAMVNSEGRFTAGPAIISATAAPAGAPAASMIKARRISKNVGSAKGIAINATSMITTSCPPDEASVPSGNHSAIAIETSTPTAINGMVRIATCQHDFKKVFSSGSFSSPTLAGQSTGA